MSTPTILRLTQFPSDANGHGACRRTLQIRETAEAAGFRVEDIPMGGLVLGRVQRWSRGLGWKLRWGRHLSHQRLGPGLAGYYDAAYTRTLAAHPGPKVALWETTYDMIFPRLARKFGYRLVALPHNLETLGMEHSNGASAAALFADEVDRLREADVIFTIAREEQWLLGTLNVVADYLPYFPPREAATRLRAVRALRRTTLPRDFVLVLGNALHPPTAEGMHAAIQDILPVLPAGWRISVAGYGSEKLAVSEPRVDLHGSVTPPQLETLLTQTRALIANQRTGAGALTRIPEALLAGVPVFANPVAARSTAGLTGVHVYEDRATLGRLLTEPMQVPPEPLPPTAAATRFERALQTFAAAPS